MASLNLLTVCNLLKIDYLGDWPNAFELPQIVEMQCAERDSTYRRLMRDAIFKSCQDRTLNHVTSVEMRFLKREPTATRNLSHHELMRVYLSDRPQRAQPTDIWTIAAIDLKDWFEVQGVTPSTHVAHWFSGIVRADYQLPALELATPVPATALIAVPKQRAQENRILELLTANNYDPVKLPKRAPGKPGTKAEIKALAMNETNVFTTKTFDTAWGRLRSFRSIVDAE